MKTIQTIAIEPTTGTSKANGACRLAFVDIFMPESELTLRGLELTYDVDQGWQVCSRAPKRGFKPFIWRARSALDVAIAASA